MKCNCRTEIFLHSLQLGLWIHAEPIVDDEINVKTEWTCQLDQCEGLRSWQVCNRGNSECLTTNARECSSKKNAVIILHEFTLHHCCCKTKTSLTAKQISSYIGLWSLPGDGLWWGTHICGSSKTEPNLPDGQFHATGVRRRGHEGEVFLQVIWLHPFILYSMKEQDITGR